MKYLRIFLASALAINLIFTGWPISLLSNQINQVQAADTGFLNATSNAAVTTNAGDNNGYQTNPTNAYADNTNSAVDTDSGANTNNTCTVIGSDKHNYYNYNISLPSEAVITGIEVKQDIAVDSLTDSPFSCVQLSWDGGTTWTTATSQTLSATAQTTYTYGGSANIWGRTWATSELTNANFRVRAINGDTRNNRSNRDFSLDWIPVKIHYSLPNRDQIHYRWRNDDNSETAATWAANEDTKLTDLATNTIIRLRMEISNEGAASTPSTPYRLEVSGANPSSCSSATYTRISASADWQMANSSNLTDGNSTTNVANGLTDENTTFVAGQVKDTSDETTGITLTSTQFTEIEYSLKSITNDDTGPSYCFRLTNSGSTNNFTYTRYAEVAIMAAGELALTAPTSTTMTAVNYSFSGQTSSGNSLGLLNITDTRGGTPGWSVDVTGEDWTATSSETMDYDGDGTNTGQLTIDLNSASITANSGSLSGLSLGGTDSFDSGTNNINIITATAGNGTGDYDINGINLDQFIPANQPTSNYTMVLTFTAS